MPVRIHASEIEMASTAELLEYAGNARTHPHEQIAQLAGIIQDSGFTNPLLVDADGTIIAGHGRLAAARLLGMGAVPIIRVTGLSPEQIRALRISDNATGLRSGWDEDSLRAELDALGAAAFDMDLLGFGDEELAALLATPEGAVDPDEAPPAPADPVSRLGDVWLMGKHRLACGDCTEAAVVRSARGGGQPPSHGH